MQQINQLNKYLLIKKDKIKANLTIWKILKGFAEYTKLGCKDMRIRKFKFEMCLLYTVLTVQCAPCTVLYSTVWSWDSILSFVDSTLYKVLYSTVYTIPVLCSITSTRLGGTFKSCGMIIYAEPILSQYNFLNEEKQFHSC